MKNCLYPRILLLLIFILPQCSFGIEKTGLEMLYYKEELKLSLKEGKPFSKRTISLAFKFNNEKALSQLNEYAVFYSYNDDLQEIEAYTLNPTGGKDGKTKKIKITDFKTNHDIDNNIFYDDEKQVKFSFPGITVGSEVYINYTVYTNELHFSIPFYFESYVPVKEFSYRVTATKDIKTQFFEKNFGNHNIEHHTGNSKNENINEWSAYNVPETKLFSDAPGRSYYSPHVIVNINSINDDDKIIPYLSTVNDLYSWYYSNTKVINLAVPDNVKMLADSICSDKKTDIEKIESIYKWVQKNIHYVAFEDGRGGIVPRNAEVVCNKRYGDCKDMASLLNQLLKAQNINGYMTWIGTHKLPYKYSEIPMKNVDNHMIVSVKEKNDWLYLDATDPNGIFGLPTTHIQGKEALIGINKDQFVLATVPVVASSVNEIVDTFQIEIENNDMQVNTQAHYKGYDAGINKDQIMYLNEKEKEDYIKNIFKYGNSNFQLIKYTIDNNTKDSTLDLKCSFKIVNHVRKIGTDLFINPFIDLYYSNASIDTSIRKVPKEFRFNQSLSTVYKITIPTGYTITALPKNVKKESSIFSFAINYKLENNILICNQEISVNLPDLLLMPTQFSTWNSLISALNQCYNESLNLIKK